MVKELNFLRSCCPRIEFRKLFNLPWRAVNLRSENVKKMISFWSAAGDVKIEISNIRHVFCNRIKAHFLSRLLSFFKVQYVCISSF